METMACQEMEAHQEEKKPTSVDIKPEAAEREVPTEDAEVMPVGEPKKKRRRDRKPAAERRCHKPKTSTRENCGPQKRLVVARRGTSRREKVTRHTKETDKMPRRMRDIFRPNTAHRAGVVRCKENAIWKVRARDNAVRGTWEGWTPRWRQLICQEGTKETRNRDFENQLRLERKWTLWRGRPPPPKKKKTEKETANRGGTDNVEKPASPV
jgi:hypothetical protein